MDENIHLPDRVSLGFAEAVESSFGFLTTEYGFKCVRVMPTLVRYESSRVCVNLYHGRSSYELGFEVALLPRGRGQPEEPFSLGDILDLCSVREELGFTFLQASTEERVRRFVPQLAELARQYAGPVLKGEPDLFMRLREVQTAKSRRYLREAELRQLREQADRAWQEKQFPLIVKLYESMGDDVTRSEAAKLVYARKQVPP
jgi:hypothetical protein